MKRIKTFELHNESLEEQRDLNIMRQLESFIEFFNPVVTDEKIDTYMQNTMMNTSAFIGYLKGTKQHLLSKSDNPTFGQLVDDYCDIVDEIIDRLS
jgi:hypothetical protein